MEQKVIVRVLILCVVPFISIYLSNFLFKKLSVKKKNLALSFLKNSIEFLIVLFCIIGIVDAFDPQHMISQRILLSSSVIAIVLGIVFQTGLTNLVHGIMLVIYKPFNVGDRVQVSVNEGISGYVKQITLRHVVISGIVDNADMIIPNSVIETCVIRNLSNGVNDINKYPFTVSMTYEQAGIKDKRELAKHIISECILENPRTVNVRPGDSEDLFVKVEYAQSSVDLTCFVETTTPEANFLACSEIKEAILDRFSECEIEFAYNHLTISMDKSFLGKGDKNENL